MSCSFCHYAGELDPIGKVNEETELSLSDVRKFIDQGFLSSPSKVCLYGGEPMLNESFFEVVEYLNENSYVSSTITNGTYLKKYLKKLLASPLHQITVSYYEGVADRFENEIKKLSEVSIVNISIIISADTFHGLENVVSFALRVGAKFITVENIVERPECERKAVFLNEPYLAFKQELLRRYSDRVIFRWSEVRRSAAKGDQKISCSNPWDMMILGKNGRVLPCCQYPLEELGQEESLPERVFNTTALTKVRREMREGKVPSLCVGCHYLYAKDPFYTFKE